MADQHDATTDGAAAPVMPLFPSVSVDPDFHLPSERRVWAEAFRHLFPRAS
ncbi:MULTISPECIES: hypothetical protein [Microbacterium]|uniref:hypothetical protein n=1 Tax=Microbacterium TaxID=33882 RepID=UPI00217ECC92|nr:MULTISPECIES: hypothetical protein [Microbacterium]UWF77630.1 hypothetical protein JSY13_00610 [Microbacterium neungamense]WCM55800.1 hypothetical protein JRG78_00625 [Microbacterium sp. EF45047]